MLFFLEISAIFEGDAINNIVSLLKLTIQTKTFSSLDANKSKQKTIIFSKNIGNEDSEKKNCLSNEITPQNFFRKLGSCQIF